MKEDSQLNHKYLKYLINKNLKETANQVKKKLLKMKISKIKIFFLVIKIKVKVVLLINKIENC